MMLIQIGLAVMATGLAKIFGLNIFSNTFSMHLFEVGFCLFTAGVCWLLSRSDQ